MKFLYGNLHESWRKLVLALLTLTLSGHCQDKLIPSGLFQETSYDYKVSEPYWLCGCVLRGRSFSEVKHILSIGLGSRNFAPLFTAWWLFLQEGLLEVEELTCLYKSDDIVGVDSYLQPTGAGGWRVLWKQSCHRKADENRRGPSVTKQTLLKKVRAFTCNCLCADPTHKRFLYLWMEKRTSAEFMNAITHAKSSVPCWLLLLNILNELWGRVNGKNILFLLHTCFTDALTSRRTPHLITTSAAISLCGHKGKQL